MLESVEQLRKEIGILESNNIDTYELERIADAIEREVEERYIELPKDESGEPIRVGDRLHPWNDREEVIEVRAIIDSNAFATCDSEIHFVRCNDPSIWVHHKPPTVEDVLEEFANLVRNEQVERAQISDDTVAEYAAKLQLREAE